jgi:hypothetical protein
MKKTFKIQHIEKNETLYVDIAFGETKENPYFSCTGALVKGIRKEETWNKIPDSSVIMCGCIHTTISEKTQEFADIIALHLSDENGVPMHVVENGYYFLSKGEIQVLADHLRISLADAQKLSDEIRSIPTGNKISGPYAHKNRFAAFVDAQLPRWKAEADAVKAKYFS